MTAWLAQAWRRPRKVMFGWMFARLTAARIGSA
jgi:hypothetical protein